MIDDLFTPENLRKALGSRPFQFEPITGSTNDLARQLALQGISAGAVVLAEEQTAGRGRYNRVWTAPAGTSLLMSVILRPHIAVSFLPRLTMVGAVAVAETLNNVPNIGVDQVRLKWPNDVLLANRKVAGILPEAIWQGDKLEAVILGIGLNVRTDFTDTPLADRAISIEHVAGSVDRFALLAALLRRIDYWSMRVDETALIEIWAGMLDTLGKTITVKVAQGEITGKATSIDHNGALLLQSDDGVIHSVMAGEIG